MNDRKRRVQTRRTDDSPEMREARQRAEFEQLRDYVHEQLGEEGEMEEVLMTLCAHLIATISDLREAAVLAQTTLHGGSQREAMSQFFDVVIEVCDITDKRAILESLFPDHRTEIDELLRNPDGTPR